MIIIRAYPHTQKNTHSKGSRYLQQLHHYCGLQSRRQRDRSRIALQLWINNSPPISTALSSVVSSISYPVSRGLSDECSSTAAWITIKWQDIFIFLISEPYCLHSASKEFFDHCLRRRRQHIKSFLTHQIPFYCTDNDLIMGMGKMRGIANYGVNAVERSRVEEAALPR